MGKKYGSIHIRTTRGSEIADKILFQNNNGPNEYLLSAERLEQTHYQAMHDMAKALRRYALLASDELFVVITSTCVSLYNKDMSFQTITKKARALAKKFHEPILYTSNFDDDVFVFGLLVEGKTVTSGRICNAPEFYDLTTKIANMDPLYRALCGEYLQPQKMPTNIFELEELLSSIMGVPLFTYAEDLDDDPEHFERLEERNGVRLYQKLK